MSKSLNEVRRLDDQQTRRLFRLLQLNPRQEEIEAFVDSCLQEETSPISTSQRIQNSQLSAAVSLMSSNDLRKLSGEH